MNNMCFQLSRIHSFLVTALSKYSSDVTLNVMAFQSTGIPIVLQLFVINI